MVAAQVESKFARSTPVIRKFMKINSFNLTTNCFLRATALCGLVFILGCSEATPLPNLPVSPASNALQKNLLDSEPLQQKIAKVLSQNLDNRLLDSDRNAAWQVFHGLLAYGSELPMQVGDRKELALDFLLDGGTLEGWELSPGTKLPNGRTGVRSHVEANGFSSQGHVDQWLAILAQLNVPADRVVKIANREFTIADWANQSQFDVPQNPLQEFSWTIIASMHYFPDRLEWVGIDNTPVSLATLVQFEADQDVNDSACGGSHRLMSLAKAVEFAEQRNLTQQPAFAAARTKLQSNLETMRRYQNSDGTFSTNYFERPGTSADLSLMISATGHQLELAAFALPQEKLEQPWMQNAARRFCELSEATADQPLECGGLYHGLNGLRIYHNRLWGDWNEG